MNRLKALGLLFLSMLKIGVFTFGGGYAMIGILEREFVEKKKWLDSEEFMDLVTIAESTPGPIAINCATYIGYKTEKITGSVIATLGMTIPSFAIIYCISLFFNQFLSVSWVASAFMGIQSAVVFLILSAGLKMLKKMKRTPFNITVFAITLICMISFSLLRVSFSSIFYILIFASIASVIYAVRYFKEKMRDGK